MKVEILTALEDLRRQRGVLRAQDVVLRDIVDAAGKRIGLGDFRPDCKGPFGKFVVTRWVEEAQLEAVA